MIGKINRAAILTVATIASVFGQTPTPQPSPNRTETSVAKPGQTELPLQSDVNKPLMQADLDKILTEAEKQIVNYQETFKDLLATEIKTFEEYDKNGELENETVVESNFLVYQSAKDASRSAELRNVLKVDGKLIPDSQARADRFLGELQKAKTLERELEKIQDEGLRYDETIKIINFTLFEGLILANNLRPFFDFKLIGTENFEGSEVFVVAYQQTRKSPFITIDEKESKEPGSKLDIDLNLPGAFKKSDKFLRGKLWIDAKTFQLRREERTITVQSNAATPLVVQETVFEYAPSEYGILVPRRIIFTDNILKKVSKDNYNAVKDARVTFDYSKFKKTNVEVQIVDEP